MPENSDNKKHTDTKFDNMVNDIENGKTSNNTKSDSIALTIITRYAKNLLLGIINNLVCFDDTIITKKAPFVNGAFVMECNYTPNLFNE